MTWLLIFAVLIVALVAGAVLPRRADFGGTGLFPWFWILFPAATLLVALAVGAWLPGSGVRAGGGNFAWTVYTPLEPAQDSHWYDYLSDAPGWRLLLFGEYGRYIYPLVAVLLLGLSALAWRRRRI